MVRVMAKFVLMHSAQELLMDTGKLPQLFAKMVEELDLLVLVRNGQEALGHVAMFLASLVHIKTFPNNLRPKKNVYEYSGQTPMIPDTFGKMMTAG
jgi:hypothetical protein